MNTLIIYVLVMVMNGSGKAIHSVPIGNLTQCETAKEIVLSETSIPRAVCIATYKEPPHD